MTLPRRLCTSALPTLLMMALVVFCLLSGLVRRNDLIAQELLPSWLRGQQASKLDRARRKEQRMSRVRTQKGMGSMAVCIQQSQ